jgi:hypothetical protein
VIENTTVQNQVHGMIARDHTRVTARGSVFSGNSSFGIMGAVLGGGSAEINVESCPVTGNGTGLSIGSAEVLHVANTFISGNCVGVSAGAGIAGTFFDNKLSGNSIDGSFNAMLNTN